MLSRSMARHGRRAVVVAALASALTTMGCLKKSAPPPSRFASRQTEYNYLGRPSGEGGGGVLAQKQLISSALASSPSPESPISRKIIRNGSLELLVRDVGQSIESISSITAAVGGYVEKSTQANSGFHSASLTIRIPSARLDQTISDIKRLATVVERESVEARDVTREYIDLDARLRNAQAEETQYLQILKRATTIKDTLDVTEKLSDVRGRIEEMQGEMKLLTTQIDMSSLEISLHSEAESTVAGIRWRPLVQARIAVNDMLSGLTDWVDSVVAFVIYLPLIIVWGISIVVLLVIIVRVVRFLWRRLGPKISWSIFRKGSTGPGQPAAHGTVSAQS